MNPWAAFFIGLFIGFLIGLFLFSLLNAAK